MNNIRENRRWAKEFRCESGCGENSNDPTFSVKDKELNE